MMRADLQTLVDRYGATGWHYAPVDPATPRFYTLLDGSGHLTPQQVDDAVRNPGGGDSGPGMGDFAARTWGQYPDGPITLTDTIRGFVWCDAMPQYVTRCYEIRDEGMYAQGPIGKSFFDRFTYGLAVGMVAGGAVAIGAGFAGIDVAAALTTTPAGVAPAVPTVIPDVAPVITATAPVVAAPTGYTMAEVMAAAKTTVGVVQTAAGAAKIIATAAANPGAISSAGFSTQQVAAAASPPVPPPSDNTMIYIGAALLAAMVLQ